MTKECDGYVVALWGDDGSVDWAYVGDSFDDQFLQLLAGAVGDTQET